MIWLAALTLLFGLVPLGVYAWARSTGAIPSEADWNLRGGNHGPLWGSDYSLLVYLQIFLLPLMIFWTALMTAFYSWKQRSLFLLIGGIALVLLQLGLAFWQLMTIFWLFD